jgi:EAL domain-containing protein (putative c-di-GMP-specific phosphodiesterase class I)
MPKILIIDDEVDVGEFIVAVADALDMPCMATNTAKDFLEALTSETSLIFLDLVMPQLDGIELLRLLSEQSHKPKIVLMSGIGKRIIETAHRLAESLGLTIVGELQKPFRLTEVETLLKQQSSPSESPLPKANAQFHISEEEIRRAIQRNEFVLHYQPQIRLSDNHVVGIEALVRWQHPEHGTIFPDNFIALTERLGLIDDLGWIVATLGLAEYRSLIQIAEDELTLSINVSVGSLRDLTFPDRLLALLHHHGISPGQLIVEITESGLIKELSSALDVLTRLRMKGVKLSIDDFGTGYSMMQQLSLVPANELKIDKSFVQKLHTGDSDRVMVMKTIEIAHELDMSVIAEGVETEAQLDFLKEHDCDVVQGYLFSRPIPADALRQWLLSQTNRLHPIGRLP